MKSQPNRDYVSNDDVQTPDPMALAIVQHFKPAGWVLEPCSGEGAFIRALEKQPDVKRIFQCEIKGGADFMDWTARVQWAVTNPPWSKFRDFLGRAMDVADNVVFLVTVNHAWTKARIRDVHQAGFGMKEILLVDMPKSFPQSGFQLGAVHWQRGWTGDIKLSRL